MTPAESIAYKYGLISAELAIVKSTARTLLTFIGNHWESLVDGIKDLDDSEGSALCDKLVFYCSELSDKVRDDE